MEAFPIGKAIASVANRVLSGRRDSLAAGSTALPFALEAIAKPPLAPERNPVGVVGLPDSNPGLHRRSGATLGLVRNPFGIGVLRWPLKNRDPSGRPNRLLLSPLRLGFH